MSGENVKSLREDFEKLRVLVRDMSNKLNTLAFDLKNNKEKEDHADDLITELLCEVNSEKLSLSSFTQKLDEKEEDELVLEKGAIYETANGSIVLYTGILENCSDYDMRVLSGGHGVEGNEGSSADDEFFGDNCFNSKWCAEESYYSTIYSKLKPIKKLYSPRELED